MHSIRKIAAAALFASGLAFGLGAVAAHAQDAMTKTDTMAPHHKMMKTTKKSSMRSDSMKAAKHDSMGSMGASDKMGATGH